MPVAYVRFAKEPISLLGGLPGHACHVGKIEELS